MDAPEPGDLYEHAPCGLLLMSPDGIIARANATFCSWVGFAPEELENARRFQDMLTIGGRVFYQTHLAPLLQMQGSVSEVKLDILHRDGRAIPILANAARRRHGERVCDEIAILVATDRQKYEHELVLARRTAESANERLAAEDRRKDEFLATLAHELRGPLAPMTNVLDGLRRKTIADPDVRRSREVLDRQLRQMTRLVDELLDISRITQGKLRLRPEPMTLADAIAVAIEGVEPLTAAARQTLTVSGPDEPMWLSADPARLTQIILNLLVNASKFTPEGGSIRVTTSRDGPWTVCAVRDSGIGIESRNLATIFEMFSQAETALERTTGGLGIGLALVRGLVELHGGTVGVTSGGRGAGSEFTVRLPSAEPPAAAAPEPAVVANGRPRRILIVDDNVDSAETMAELLGLDGHETRTAHDGPSALEVVAEGRTEVVLLDLGLPGMSGFETARRMRATAAGQAVLLIAATGWGQQRDVDASKAAGFDHHLVKPVDMAALDGLLR